MQLYLDIHIPLFIPGIFLVISIVIRLIYVELSLKEQKPCVENVREEIVSTRFLIEKVSYFRALVQSLFSSKMFLHQAFLFI